MSEIDLSAATDASLEAAVAGVRWTTDAGGGGAAAAELTKRRRAYEGARDARRREHEIKLAELTGRYAAVQQDHEEKIARMQMTHAESLANRELSAARAVAKATWLAAVAA